MQCYNENSELYETLSILQEIGKINKFVPQIYYNQSELLIQKNVKKASVAFYGSLLGIHLSEELIQKDLLVNSIAMYIFGGVDFGHSPVFKTADEEKYWNK